MDSDKIQNYIEILESVLDEDVVACDDCQGKDKCNTGKANICKHMVLKELKSELEKGDLLM